MNSNSHAAGALFEPLEPRLLLSTTIFSEDFEGAFPGPWSLIASQGRQWVESPNDPHSGSNSAYCAGYTSGVDATSYIDNLNTFMTRVVDLTSYDTARLTFQSKTNAQRGYDFLGLRAGPEDNMRTVWSNEGGQYDWTPAGVILDEYCGQAAVMIEFWFHSNDSYVPTGVSGVWLDDIVLTGDSTASSDPDDQISEARVIDVPTPIFDEIDPALGGKDVDMYSFTVDAGTRSGSTSICPRGRSTR